MVGSTMVLGKEIHPQNHIQIVEFNRIKSILWLKDLTTIKKWKNVWLHNQITQK